jgi:hypothetical protein
MFPSFPLAGRVGTPGRYTGRYGDLCGDSTVTSQYSIAFDVSSTLSVTGADKQAAITPSYLGIQVTAGDSR